MEKGQNRKGTKSEGQIGRGKTGRGEMGINLGRNGKGQIGKGRTGNKPDQLYTCISIYGPCVERLKKIFVVTIFLKNKT